MYLLSVRFRSEKAISEIEEMTRATLPMFRELPGLIEKYYVEDEETGHVGGVYVWETLEQLQNYLNGPIIAAMPERMAMPEPPTFEILEVRDEFAPAQSADDGRYIGSVRFTSRLPIDELEKMSAASMDAYQDLPDLLKVFRVVDTESGRVGGVYVWANKAALEQNLSSPEFSQVPELFQVEGSVEISRLRVSFALTD